MGRTEELKARFGHHMDESMGRGASPGPPAPGEPHNPGPMRGRQQGVTRFRDASRIELDRIMADPNQPRTEFPEEELNRLAASLEARGLLQPIRVRWSPDDDKYVILAGERRWRAAALAGLAALECVIEDRDLGPAEILRDQIVENCLREDLRPIEQARAYRRLMDATGWSARQVAQELHLAHGTVGKALALLELPDEIREMVERGDLPPATAYEIRKAGSDADRLELARRVRSEGLTRDQVVASRKGEGDGARGPAAGRAKREIRLEDGTRVAVTGPAVAGGPGAVADALDRARARFLDEAGTGDRAA